MREYTYIIILLITFPGAAAIREYIGRGKNAASLRKSWEITAGKEAAITLITVNIQSLTISCALGVGFREITAVQILLLTAIEDFTSKRIPNKYILWLTVTEASFTAAERIIFKTCGCWEEFGCVSVKDRIISCVAFAAVLSFLSYVTKGGFGMGDAKLAAAAAFIAGFSYGAGIFCTAVLLSASVGIPLAIVMKMSGKSEIPFAPFFVLSFLIYLL